MVIYSVTKTMIETRRLKPLGEFFTLAIILSIEFIWLNLSIYEQYNGIILVNFGVIMSLIICKIIISSVTKVILFSISRCNCNIFIQKLFPQLLVPFSWLDLIWDIISRERLLCSGPCSSLIWYWPLGSCIRLLGRLRNIWEFIVSVFRKRIRMKRHCEYFLIDYFLTFKLFNINFNIINHQRFSRI